MNALVATLSRSMEEEHEGVTLEEATELFHA